MWKYVESIFIQSGWSLAINFSRICTWKRQINTVHRLFQVVHFYVKADGSLKHQFRQRRLLIRKNATRSYVNEKSPPLSLPPTTVVSLRSSESGHAPLLKERAGAKLRVEESSTSRGHLRKCTPQLICGDEHLGELRWLHHNLGVCMGAGRRRWEGAPLHIRSTEGKSWECRCTSVWCFDFIILFHLLVLPSTGYIVSRVEQNAKVLFVLSLKCFFH